MALRTWKRLRRRNLLRPILWAGLVVALPTSGVLASCLVAAVPLLLARVIAPGNDTAASVAAVLAVVAWLAAAATIAVGALRLSGLIGQIRVARGTVSLGADGLRWRDWLKPRFVGWSQVETVRLVDEPERSVVFELRNGNERRLSVEDSDDLLAVATDLLDRWRSRQARGEVKRLRIDPDGGLKGWLERARDLLASSSYRQESVAPEELVQLAEDPKAPPEQRIGAALALSRSPEPLRARVRVAVEDTADPAMAEALGQAIEGELRVRTAARVIDASRLAAR